MATHIMKLSNEPFEKIANGQKTIESRLFDEKRQKINVGDTIKFSSNNDTEHTITTKVKALYHHDSFNDLFSDFPPQYFGGESKESLLKEIHQFYSMEDEARFGVVGISIEKIDENMI
jgi:ASC-1-like (ASCH) protein